MDTDTHTQGATDKERPITQNTQKPPQSRSRHRASLNNQGQAEPPSQPNPNSDHPQNQTTEPFPAHINRARKKQPIQNTTQAEQSLQPTPSHQGKPKHEPRQFEPNHSKPKHKETQNKPAPYNATTQTQSPNSKPTPK